MTRWTYATLRLGLPVADLQWHVVNQTFDSVDAAAEAAKRWLIICAEHGAEMWAVRLERIDELPAA